MGNVRTLLFQFYKPFLYYHLFFTGLSLYLLLIQGAIAFILALPLKLVGYAGFVFYQHNFYKHEYFYYRNAGMPMQRLYLYSLTPDFCMYLLLACISIFIHNQYA